MKFLYILVVNEYEPEDNDGEGGWYDVVDIYPPRDFQWESPESKNIFIVSDDDYDILMGEDRYAAELHANEILLDFEFTGENK